MKRIVTLALLCLLLVGLLAPSASAQIPWLPPSGAAPETTIQSWKDNDSTQPIDEDENGTETTRVTYSISNADGAQYSLDGSAWASLGASPAAVTVPADGKEHTLQVRAARSSDGAVDATPAEAKITMCPQRGCSATTPPATDGSYEGPKTITTGGTYTGNWESTNPNTPAVSVQTTQPVVIEHCKTRSKGKHFNVASGGNVTIRGCSSLGLNPGVTGYFPGRFVNAESVNNLRIHNNYLEQTSGIWVHRYAGPGTIKVLNNKVKNIDGRKVGGGKHLVQFAQFDKVRNISGMEIAYNEVINEPYNSAVEDVISIYMTSGKSSSPIDIHDNYIQGAYNPDPKVAGYSGGGIMLGDGGGSDPTTVPEYVIAHHNQVVGSQNYALAIAEGRNLHYYNNRAISSSELPAGSRMASQNSGMYVWNASGATLWANNRATNNEAAWEVGNGSRADWWFPGCNPSGACTGNVHLSPTDVTRAMEQQEYQAWLAKGYQVGP